MHFKRFSGFISVSDVSLRFETCYMHLLCVSIVVILTHVSLKRFLCISLKPFWDMSYETFLKHFKTVSITFHFCVFYVSRTLFLNCCLYCFKCVSMKHCAAYFRFHWNVSETFQWNLDLKWFRSVLIRFTCTFGYLTMKQRNSACNDYLYIQHQFKILKNCWNNTHCNCKM